jgi:CheY-like chemotaxis protein
MATRRVLIVDDEADVRKTLTDILRAMRYGEPLEVEEVPDGREGLDAVVHQRPDLILLDLQMPRMDGLALLK